MNIKDLPRDSHEYRKEKQCLEVSDRERVNDFRQVMCGIVIRRLL